MLKKTITYTNPFTDEQVSEEHYFHFSKADMVEIEMEGHGQKYTDKTGKEHEGIQAYLTRIMESEDGKAILSEFKNFLRRSYGKKDGDRFIKSPAVWEEFQSSEAYSQFLFELCTNAGEAAEFVNGIFPSDLAQEAARIATRADDGAATPEPVAVSTPENPDVEPPVEERMTAERKAVLDLASSSNPIKLDSTDLINGDSDYIRAGLRSGRFTT